MNDAAVAVLSAVHLKLRTDPSVFEQEGVCWLKDPSGALMVSNLNAPCQILKRAKTKSLAQAEDDWEEEAKRCGLT